MALGALPRGHDGWRSVCALLDRQGQGVPTRLVQESLHALKRASADRIRARIEKARVHVEVLARNALWALDQTHLARGKGGALKALAVRESVVPRTLGLSIGPPACAEDVVRLLQATAAQRGAWPLVLQVDNGPENKNAAVKTLLENQRVIALWNEPHTPEHNGRIERTIGSLKRAGSLDQRERVTPHEIGHARHLLTTKSVCGRLFEAWASLDARTPRWELGGLTPAELDRIAPRAEDRVSRDRFYTDVRDGLRRIVLAQSDRRAQRKAEREAIWCALEKHGLIRRTGGGCRVPALKEEVVS